MVLEWVTVDTTHMDFMILICPIWQDIMIHSVHGDMILSIARTDIAQCIEIP